MKIINYEFILVLFSFISHVIIYGTTWSIGIFTKIFENAFDEENIVFISLLGSCNTAAMYGICPIAVFLNYIFGYRFVAILGALLAVLGFVITYFATDIMVIFAGFSIITGMGLGLAYIPAVTIVSSLDKNRNIFVGFAVSGVGCGTLIYPCILDSLTSHFHWRCSMLIVLGITLNLLIPAVYFGFYNNIKTSRLCIKVTPQTDITLKCTAVDDNKTKCNIGCERFKKLKNCLKTSRNFTIMKLISLMNFKLFKIMDFFILCVNNFFIQCSLSIFFIYLNRYSEDLGYNSFQNSAIIEVLGISNLLSRIGYGILTNFEIIESISSYYVSISILGMVALLIPLFKSYTMLVINAALIGCLSAPVGCLLPTVLIKIIGKENFPQGYGYLMVFEAVGFMLGAPLGGKVYKHTGEITNCFIVSGLILIVGNAIMIIPWKHNTS